MRRDSQPRYPSPADASRPVPLPSPQPLDGEDAPSSFTRTHPSSKAIHPATRLPQGFVPVGHGHGHGHHPATPLRHMSNGTGASSDTLSTVSTEITPPSAPNGCRISSAAHRGTTSPSRPPEVISVSPTTGAMQRRRRRRKRSHVPSHPHRLRHPLPHLPTPLLLPQHAQAAREEGEHLSPCSAHALHHLPHQGLAFLACSS